MLWFGVRRSKAGVLSKRLHGSSWFSTQRLRAFRYLKNKSTSLWNLVSNSEQPIFLIFFFATASSPSRVYYTEHHFCLQQYAHDIERRTIHLRQPRLMYVCLLLQEVNFVLEFPRVFQTVLIDTRCLRKYKFCKLNCLCRKKGPGINISALQLFVKADTNIVPCYNLLLRSGIIRILITVITL